MKDYLKVRIKESVDLFILDYRIKKMLAKNYIENEKVNIIARELATNILKYGGHGYIEIIIDSQKIVIVGFDYSAPLENKENLGISSGLNLGMKVIKNNSHSLKIKKNKFGGLIITSIVKLTSINYSEFKIQFGISSRPHKTEKRNGDICIIKNIDDKYIVVVADVLGHGDKASIVADIIKEHTLNYSIQNISNFFYSLEKKISNTRGCALFTTIISRNIIEYINIGNIKAWFVNNKNSKQLYQSPGIVGRHHIKFNINKEINSLYNSLLIICTDGISSKFKTPHDLYININDDPQNISDKILDVYGILEDDATCVVIKED